MDVQTNDIMTLAALVAAYVGVIKALTTGTKYEAASLRLASVFSVIIAAVFVMVPDAVQAKMITISVIGLTASGAYAFTKNKTGSGGNGGSGAA